jgi:hypothetical protein
MVALPRATLPPMGNWLIAGGGDWAPAPPSVKPSDTDTTVPVVRDLTLFLPDVLAVSGTACHDCVAIDQIVLKTWFIGVA